MRLVLEDSRIRSANKYRQNYGGGRDIDSERMGGSIY